MTSIEGQELQQRDKAGRLRTVVRYKVRYRDRAGRARSETKRPLADAHSSRPPAYDPCAVGDDPVASSAA